MSLTRDYKITIQERLQVDHAFRSELLREGVELMLRGDMETGKTILHEYVNGTIGFEPLGALVGISPHSLRCMFEVDGDPSARDLFAVIESLQHQADLSFRVVTQPQ
jgi:hypothetical protein